MEWNLSVPARIASFSQSIQLPLRAAATLSCLAVGNPIPRTRWMHRGRPVTHSPHYQVTQKGHLEIHSKIKIHSLEHLLRASSGSCRENNNNNVFIPGMDSSLSGNYTCSAKNLLGEDSVTYGISALLPPSSPQLRLQHAATTSLKVHWQTPPDGGSQIQSMYFS